MKGMIPPAFSTEVLKCSVAASLRASREKELIRMFQMWKSFSRRASLMFDSLRDVFDTHIVSWIVVLSLEMGSLVVPEISTAAMDGILA